MTYDEEHPETGSSNISKASPEWLEKLAEARARHDTTPHNRVLRGFVLHQAYDLVNEEVTRGIPWANCANCGSPYRVTPEWSSSELCSLACQAEYVDYLNNPDG